MAVALAASESKGDRAVRAAVKLVAGYLGNTPTVARNSYIDPRVFDRYRDGVTIEVGLSRGGELSRRRRGQIERAVLDLVS